MVQRPAQGLALCALLGVVGAFGWFVFAILFAATAGQDWMVFDAAARAYWRGDTALILDGAGLTRAINATYPTLTQKILFHPWVYPPYTLLLALPFGLLPWLASYAGFQLLSFAALAASLRAWSGPGARFWLRLGGVLLCPASAYTIGAGQNSFLSASLVLGGLWHLQARPILAGALLGLLAFKPQLGLLIPVALIAAGAWRAIASACATVALLILISLVVPGLAVWRGWFALYLGSDAPRQWVELYGQSVFTCLRLAGAPATWANTGQALALALGAAFVWHEFRLPRAASIAPRRRLLVLLCAITFASPHVGDYDAVLVAVAAMFVLLPRPDGEPSFGAGARALAALCWCLTAINPPLLFLKTIPPLFPLAELTPLALLAFLALLSRRAGDVRPARVAECV